MIDFERDAESLWAIEDDKRLCQMFREAEAYDHGAQPEDFIVGAPVIPHLPELGEVCCRGCGELEAEGRWR